MKTATANCPECHRSEYLHADEDSAVCLNCGWDSDGECDVETNAQSFEEGLLEILREQEALDSTGADVVSAVTFENAGVLTMNRGIVVRLGDGTEFQLTIVQSR